MPHRRVSLAVSRRVLKPTLRLGTGGRSAVWDTPETVSLNDFRCGNGTNLYRRNGLVMLGTSAVLASVQVPASMSKVKVVGSTHHAGKKNTGPRCGG